MNELIKQLIGEYDEKNIKSLLTTRQKVDELIKELTQHKESINSSLRAFLKFRGWERYDDNETGISIVIQKQKLKKIDEEQLALLIIDDQLEQITTHKTIEKLLFITPQVRERMKKYVRKTI